MRVIVSVVIDRATCSCSASRSRFSKVNSRRIGGSRKGREEWFSGDKGTIVLMSVVVMVVFNLGEGGEKEEEGGRGSK